MKTQPESEISNFRVQAFVGLILKEVTIKHLGTGFVVLNSNRTGLKFFHPRARRDGCETNRSKLVSANNHPVVKMPTAQLPFPKMGE